MNRAPFSRFSHKFDFLHLQYKGLGSNATASFAAGGNGVPGGNSSSFVIDLSYSAAVAQRLGQPGNGSAGDQTVADLLRLSGLSLNGNACDRFSSSPLSNVLCSVGNSNAGGNATAAAQGAVIDASGACGVAFCCGERLPLPANSTAFVRTMVAPLRAALQNAAQPANTTDSAAGDALLPAPAKAPAAAPGAAPAAPGPDALPGQPQNATATASPPPKKALKLPPPKPAPLPPPKTLPPPPLPPPSSPPPSPPPLFPPPLPPPPSPPPTPPPSEPPSAPPLAETAAGPPAAEPPSALPVAPPSVPPLAPNSTPSAPPLAPAPSVEAAQPAEPPPAPKSLSPTTKPPKPSKKRRPPPGAPAPSPAPEVVPPLVAGGSTTPPLIIQTDAPPPPLVPGFVGFAPALAPDAASLDSSAGAGLSRGAKAGIAIGVLLGIGGAAILALLLCRCLPLWRAVRFNRAAANLFDGSASSVGVDTERGGPILPPRSAGGGRRHRSDSWASSAKGAHGQQASFILTQHKTTEMLVRTK